jgi:hypothetical protein
MTATTTPLLDRQQLAVLRHAVARASAAGASYAWIAGVLARCLAEQTTTAEAAAVAAATLREPVTPPARGLA